MNSGDILWVLASPALVLFMTAGVAFFTAVWSGERTRQPRRIHGLGVCSDSTYNAGVPIHHRHSGEPGGRSHRIGHFPAR